MKIDDLIESIKCIDDCKVYPSCGLPNIKLSNQKLPEDVERFYCLCGGADLFCSKDYSIRIVPPNEFQLSNPLIVGEICEEDISSNWYIIATDDNGQYISIDTSLERIGRCYDSFGDCHVMVGDCAIVALNFTDLIENFIKNNGDYWFWLKKEFKSLGDAYDGIKMN